MTSLMTVGQLIHDKHIVDDGDSEDGIKRFYENTGIKVFVRSQFTNTMVLVEQFEIVSTNDVDLVITQIEGQRDEPNNHMIDEAFDVDIYIHKDMLDMMSNIC